MEIEIDMDKKRAFGLNSNEYVVMWFIDQVSFGVEIEACVLSAGEIAEALALSKTTCQRIINKLFDSGLITGLKANRRENGFLMTSREWYEWGRAKPQVGNKSVSEGEIYWVKSITSNKLYV